MLLLCGCGRQARPAVKSVTRLLGVRESPALAAFLASGRAGLWDVAGPHIENTTPRQAVYGMRL